MPGNTGDSTRLSNDGNHDIAKLHRRKKTTQTKYWQENTAADSTSSLEQPPAHFKLEKGMPVVVKKKIGLRQRKKSAHD